MNPPLAKLMPKDSRMSHFSNNRRDSGPAHVGRQGGPGLGRRPGTDNEANDNAADLVAHFAVALGRAKSRRIALLDMVGEDRAQRIQNKNPLKALARANRG